MDKSKLQWCIEVLCVLAVRGNLGFKQIRRCVQLDISFLLEYLHFLVDRGLVEEQTLKNDKKAFSITNRGLSVLKVLVPLVREAHRIEVENFDRIDNIFSGLTVVSEKK